MRSGTHATVLLAGPGDAACVVRRQRGAKGAPSLLMAYITRTSHSIDVKVACIVAFQLASRNLHLAEESGMLKPIQIASQGPSRYSASPTHGPLFGKCITTKNSTESPGQVPLYE
jgi:hypothetical protein